MVAHFLQLLQDVQQTGLLPGVSALVESLVVTGEDVGVHFTLNGRQLARHLNLSHLG